jgi:hypothetical protein
MRSQSNSSGTARFDPAGALHTFGTTIRNSFNKETPSAS